MEPLSVIVVAEPDQAKPLRKLLKRLRADLPRGSEIIIVYAGDAPARVGEAVLVPRASDCSGTGRGLGAAHATRATLLFVDPETETEEGWLAPLLSALEDPEVGAAGPAVHAMESNAAPRGGMGYLDAALNLSWVPAGNRAHEITALCGCVLAMRREVYDHVGGWDESLGRYRVEDMDLGLRLARMGLKSLVVPESRVSHRFRSWNAGEYDWDDFLYRLARFALIHLEGTALEACLAGLNQHFGFIRALDRARVPEVRERHEAVAAASRFPAASVLRRLNGDIFGEGDHDYHEMNRRAYAHWAAVGIHTSVPVTDEELRQARLKIDPYGWFPWNRIRDVLCLASSGGQQAPMLAALGLNVTSFDLSPDQLELDRKVAERAGLSLKLVEGDMQDLSAFAPASFDLVFQAVSSCYVPDITRVYAQVSRVLRPGGTYNVEHWNPVQMQLNDEAKWDGSGYRIVRPQVGGLPVPWRIPGAFVDGKPVVACHYIHSLTSLLGGLGRTGFVIEHVAERGERNGHAAPGTDAHLGAYLPSLIYIVARLEPRHA